MRLLPQSLYGRLVLVLFGGLIVAQLLSAAITFAERDRMLFRFSGMGSAQRIADIVKLLDSRAPAERKEIVATLSAPPLTVTLDRAPIAETIGSAAGSAHLAMFSGILRAALGGDRPIRVAEGEGRGPGPPAFAREHREAMMSGQGPMAGMYRFPPQGLSLLAQVRLRDGSWVSFVSDVPEEAASLPQRLLVTLAILLVAVLVLSMVAVRWITRPLHVLADAAGELGRDINRPPLAEAGPAEVRQAARAFNVMQASLVRFLQDRTQLLTAMSHDMKTPITRMRLRAELLKDAEMRSSFERDLGELEAMVGETLDFMRGIDSREPPQPINVMALLESLQADYEAMGREVRIEGRTSVPYPGVPQLLKRCLTNLVDNAVLYGKRATLAIEDEPRQLTLRILDDGPGIPDTELESAFEPFYRLESSRSRETGGTGLGLSIARNIARAHGGDIVLRNRPEGGLEARLTLPRTLHGVAK